MFSYFPNHSQNVPIGSLTLQELHHQLICPDREPFSSTISIIQQLRAEKNEAEQKRIKSRLMAFTPNAMLDTKDKSATPAQKNIRFSGFMQIDIDLQENPNMTDAAAIRNKLAEIPYIALSAISARGKGVWGLLALAEPEKFTLYIDQVADYFRKARVTIDKSKSKNLTELRYFSPDPGAILNSGYKLFPLLSPKPKIASMQQVKTTHTQHKTSTLSDLQRWVTETTGYSLVDGQKHNYIFWLSYALRKNGTSETEVYNTIYSYILSSDQIKSNCIPGGIAHANAKGLYIPPIHSTKLPAVSQPSVSLKTSIIDRHYISLPNPPDTKHDYIDIDGLIYIHQPGLPEL